MTEVFVCPACGAPVNTTGGDANTRCPYCHQLMAVPLQFRSHHLTEEVARAVLESIRQGRRIDAIKTLRQVTGLGLKEAYKLVTRAEEQLDRSGEAQAEAFLLDAGSFAPAPSPLPRSTTHMQSTIFWTILVIALVFFALLALVYLVIRLA